MRTFLFCQILMILLYLGFVCYFEGHHDSGGYQSLPTLNFCSRSATAAAVDLTQLFITVLINEWQVGRQLFSQTNRKYQIKHSLEPVASLVLVMHHILDEEK